MTRFVFGSGIALVNNWNLIKKNYKPLYCVDNDCRRWGKELNTGLLCIGPEKMLTYPDPEVLITVGDPYAIESIKEQLDGLKVPYITLTDVLGKWGDKETLPDHLMPICFDKNKKILLFNTPEHDNIGDHLIALAEMNFLKERFREYSIYEITDIEYLWYGEKVRGFIEKEDVILITGGGFLGSLWLYNGETNVRNIICTFCENKIVILPQTVYFEENSRGYCEYKKTIDIYNRAKNLTVLLREKQSFDFFKRNESIKFDIELMPDMALYYQYTVKQYNRGKDAILCIRSDKESVLGDSEKKEIERIVKASGYTVNRTSMHSGKFPGLNGRKKQVDDKLDEISDSKIVITDTLHCMISAAITGTPCIAFDNLSGKVRNVYDWIKNLPYVYFCKNVSDLEQMITQVSLKKTVFKFDEKKVYLDKIEKIIKNR